MVMASSNTTVWSVIMLIMIWPPPSSSLSLAAISLTNKAFSTCPRYPITVCSSTRVTNSHCSRCHFHRDRALHSSPSSITTTTATQLDLTYASTNAADIFDAVVNARYACTRFHRHQEPVNENDGQQLPINSSISSKRIHDNMNSEKNSNSATLPTASISNSQIIQMAYQSLLLSQRAPSGFNAQPYRIVLVHSQKDKEQVAQYCLGRNADRVRDSDCTAIFLADTGVGYDGQRYIDFVKRHMMMQMNGSVEEKNDDVKRNATSTNASPSSKTTKAIQSKKNGSSRSRRSLSPRELLKVRLLILLFSSGYPLPSLLSVPLSFGVRVAVSILATIMRWLYSIQQRLILLLSTTTNHAIQSSNNNNNNNKRPILSQLLSSFIYRRKLQLLPTLYPSQTWSQKNTMLVAMTYMLSCTSHGLATCPMEGIDAVGIKKVLGVKPMRRYSIPLIVSTGIPYHHHEQNPNRERNMIEDGEAEEESMTATDDTGLSHGRGALLSPRYPPEEVVYENFFGVPFREI